MKEKVTMLIAACLLMISCSQESKKSSELTTIAIETQKDLWRKTAITPKIVENQRKISHYQFDIYELQQLINRNGVSFIWFDLGLNENSQMTISATGQDRDKLVIGQVQSKIISTDHYTTDLSIFQKVGGVPSRTNRLNHMLSNDDAFQYLNDMQKAYNQFEETLQHDGERVERFGLDALVVRRILMTTNIHSLGLFLGKNNEQKMTTVFIGKDKNGTLLIDDSSDLDGALSAFDFTSPCPDACEDCRECVQRCESPWWMCCKDKPCKGYEDQSIE